MIIVPVVVALGAYLYLRIADTASFRIMRRGVERIDLVLGANTEPAPYYSQSITGRQHVARIVDVLTAAKPTPEHRCLHDIDLAVVYANGTRVQLHPLPGHDPAFYEFRTSYGIFQIDRTQFFTVLSEAGVDTNLLTEAGLDRDEPMSLEQFANQAENQGSTTMKSTLSTEAAPGAPPVER